MDDGIGVTRRQVLWGLGSAALAAGAPAAPPEIDARVVARNDAALDNLLRAQITDPRSSRLGGVPDDYLMYHAGSAGGLIETAAASWIAPHSKHHGVPEVLERIRLAAQFLERSQNAEGNIDLLSTNFNSPPDTGFVVHNVATAAAIAKMYGAEEVLRALRPFLVKAAGGMSTGGIHTPNHRWVVSSALAQVNDVFPDPAYTRRIAQWLAEGIDIDEDGQFIERSTVTYNTVTDRAFTVLAAKLKRPELLDPVRRNLRAMMYLLHPDGEVVTEVSKRQDQFVRGTMAGYWFPVNYLAVHDGDRQFAALARGLGPEHARLSALLEYPELSAPLPQAEALPEDYEKWFGAVGLARIRRGHWDATMVLKDSSRFFSARNGGAVDQRGPLCDVVLRQGPVRAGRLREGWVEVRLPAVAERAVLPAARTGAEGGLQELGCAEVPATTVAGVQARAVGDGGRAEERVRASLAVERDSGSAPGGRNQFARRR